MGGLAAIFHLDGAPVEPERLRAMAAAAAYRGLAGVRSHVAGEAGVAHLALGVHRSGGGQPLVSGSLWLAADARLDRRGELRALLGGDLGAASDAELILAAYRRWGDRCTDHLAGDFAFVVWEPRRRRVFCARDALGIKPLHYARVGPLLCVASEAQQILAHPGVPRRLDEVTVALYLASAMDDPERTFFRGVRWLPPAHRLAATPDGLRRERFWDIDPEKRTVHRRDEDYADHLRSVLQEAVGERLRTSAPVIGVALSGGLDSSTVAAMARRRLARRTSPRLVAATLTFDQLASCDERAYVRELADELGFEALSVDAERHWFLGTREGRRPSPETPFLSWQSSLLAMLRRLRQRGARVLLTGQGGDEVLGGSSRVYWDRLRRGDLRAVGEVARYGWRSRFGVVRTLYYAFVTPFVPVVADRMLRRLLGRPIPGEIPPWIHPRLRRHSELGERLRSQPPRRFGDDARQHIYNSTVGTSSWARAVYWYDRNAARSGLEARHPFLDRRLLELVLSIPPRLLFEPGCYKPLLRRAAAGSLPDRARRRGSKVNLACFLDYSLRQQAAERIDDLLVKPLAAELGLVDGEKLRAAVRDYQTTTPDDSKRAVWQAISLELWLREHHDLYGDSYPQPFPARSRAA